MKEIVHLLNASPNISDAEMDVASIKFGCAVSRKNIYYNKMECEHSSSI